MKGKTGITSVLILILLLALFVCGCGDKSVNTFIITDELETSIETGKAYSFDGLIDGMKPKKFAGFDERENVVGLLEENGEYYIAEIDFLSGKMNVLLSSDVCIENVFVTLGNTIVYETAENNIHGIYSMGIDGANNRRITDFSADKAITAVNGNGDIVSVIADGDELSLLSTDVDSEYEHFYDIKQSYEDLKKETSKSNAAIESLALADNMYIGAVISFGTEYYVYMGSAQGGGFSGCIIDSCNNSGCVFSGEKLFYVNNGDELVNYDKKERKTTTEMVGVDKFDVSGDGKIIAGSKLGGTYIKLYVENIEADKAELIDMQKGLSGCQLNETGTYLLVECGKADQAKYYVTELII